MLPQSLRSQVLISYPSDFSPEINSVKGLQSRDKAKNSAKKYRQNVIAIAEALTDNMQKTSAETYGSRHNFIHRERAKRVSLAQYMPHIQVTAFRWFASALADRRKQRVTPGIQFAEAGCIYVGITIGRLVIYVLHVIGGTWICASQILEAISTKW